MYTLKVLGLASGTEILNTKISLSQTSTNLMELLRSLGVNIASSCFGEGICNKCTICFNKADILSCQKSLSDFPELQDKDIIIQVSYL